MKSDIRDRVVARLRSNGPPTPDSPRPRAIRVAWVAALVAGGGLLCWAAFLVEQRLSAPATPPEGRDVTFDVVVSDAVTGKAVPGAQVGTDERFKPNGRSIRTLAVRTRIITIGDPRIGRTRVAWMDA